MTFFFISAAKLVQMRGKNKILFVFSRVPPNFKTCKVLKLVQIFTKNEEMLLFQKKFVYLQHEIKN